MSLGLLAPAALAALAALLLPLLLHLARRDATRPTPFAALRWLRERPKPRRRLRFDDWPLLLARLLLLALLALWLAWPVLHGGAAPARWTVVVPGVAADAMPPTDPDAPVRWLAPGFPQARDTVAPTGPVPVASLLRELDATLPAGTALTVVVPETIDGADGGRVTLSRAVDWQVVPEASAPGAPPGAGWPQLDVFGIADDDPTLRVLAAVAHAWRPDDADALQRPTADATPRAQAALAWWSASAPPPALLEAAAGRTLLLGPAALLPEGTDWHASVDDVGFERAACGAATCVRWRGTFDPARDQELLDPGFPARLRDRLQPGPAPARIAAADLTPASGLTAYPPVPRDLRPWWALLVALAFALERWLAAAARRNMAA
ncbi:BatA domain-containing protein [Luteimonas sp. S4-F44]|uniref:BatA domain-containing protein n=1 Tax=Luteimonas sp. S4-F44 TaxID=2925842 RepID=UPI001F532CC0|nr:BatA domain-containing protein [Luteimonas sp. S4-F44]UNK41563.1 BatA domain-containing protein [Luteimonas sp. S4-F44]